MISRSSRRIIRFYPSGGGFGRMLCASLTRPGRTVSSGISSASIHKAIQTNLDDDLGTVIPGDYLYFETGEKLIQHRIVPRKLYDKTMVWIRGSEDERLKPFVRADFLINKLASANTELGLHTTVDTIADLLVENLETGSGALRARLPGILDSCDLVMKVGE